MWQLEFSINNNGYPPGNFETAGFVNVYRDVPGLQLYVWLDVLYCHGVSVAPEEGHSIYFSFDD